MSITKNRVLFDPTSGATIAASDQIGSYLFGAGGIVITSTTVGGDEALDVNIVNALSVHNEDEAHTTGDAGSFILAVRNDGGGSLVSADGDYAPFQVNASGELLVSAAISGLALDSEYAEDSAHTTADVGQFILAVANHTEGALHGTDGDYAALQVDAEGRLRIIGDLDLTGDLVADDAPDTENPLKVGSRAGSGALTAVSATGDKADLISDLYRRIWINQSMNIAIKNSTETVGIAAAEIASTPLAGRKKIIIQNLGNQAVYVGFDATVTIANGTEIPKGGSMDEFYGEDINIWMISGTAAQDVRLLEAA